MTKSYPVVLVYWRDCTTYHGWQVLSESMKTCKGCHAVTAGILVGKDRKNMKLASTVDVDMFDDGDCKITEFTLIPVDCVDHVKHIGKVHLS